MAAAAKLQLRVISSPNAMTLPSFCVSHTIQCAECDNVTNSQRRRLICRPDAERHDHSKERVYPTAKKPDRKKPRKKKQYGSKSKKKKRIIIKRRTEICLPWRLRLQEKPSPLRVLRRHRREARFLPYFTTSHSWLISNKILTAKSRVGRRSVKWETTLSYAKCATCTA